MKGIQGITAKPDSSFGGKPKALRVLPLALDLRIIFLTALKVVKSEGVTH